MAELQISLLGSPSVFIDRVEVNLQRRKSLALLAYLAVQTQSKSRDELTELLYPDVDRNRAKAGFRQILSSLRRSIGKENIKSDRFSISLNFSNNIFVDVLQFRNLINTHNYKEAIDLYNKEFLSGFFLNENYEFEEWQLSTKEQLQWEYSSILEQYVGELTNQKKFSDAITYCRLWNSLDPFDERTHRELMILYSKTSQKNKMIEQFEKCRKILRDEIGESPDDETQELFESLNEKDPPPVFLNNLPYFKSELIGRIQELEDIEQILIDEETTLLSLVGIGGTGKTLLSLYAAERTLSHFPHGVFFIDLSGIVTVDQAISLISRQLEIVDNRTSTETPVMFLKRFLCKKEMLLILDNFEQLVDGDKFIREILSACREFKILITSRIPLALEEEHIFYVPPLCIPDEREKIDKIEDVLNFEAIAFFIKMAIKVFPEFTINENNYTAILNICRNLDGLPLAIELAASRLNVLSVKEIQNHLTSKFELLVSHSSDIPERQRTMKNTIEWSFSLLNDEEQDLFEKMSVFQGSCSLHALESIWGGNVLNILSSLIKKNMIVRKEKNGKTRYSMLETLHEYALFKLDEKQKVEVNKKLHANYFLSLAKEAEPHLYGAEMVEWLERLEEDDRNFHCALGWFKEHSKIEESVVLIHSLMRYWYHRVYFSTIKIIFDQVLTRGEKLLSSFLLGKGYCSLGWMAFVTGEWQQACEAYRKALIYSVKAEDIKTQSLSLGRLGVVERWIGEMESGLEHNYEAIELARQSNDIYYIAVTLNFAYSTRGGVFKDAEPLVFLKEALRLSHETGDMWSISQSLVGLGDYYRESGNYVIALEQYKKALELYQKKRDQWMMAWTLGDLGQTLSKMGETDKGEENLRESILIMDKIGDRGSLMMMLFRLTDSLGKSGKEKQAAFYLAAAEKIFDSIISSRQNIYPIEKEMQNTIDCYKSKYKKEWSRGELMEYEELIQSISLEVYF